MEFLTYYSPDSINIDVSTPPKYWIRRKSKPFHTSESSEIETPIGNKRPVRPMFD